MYEFLKKLMMAQQVSFKEGHVQFLGEDVAFTPVTFLAEDTRKYIAKNDINGLYLSSWKSGYQITLKMVQKYKLKKFEERYSVAMDTVSMMGLGSYKTLEFKRAEYAHFRVFNNPLALYLKGKYKTPVDHFMRGANAGGGTIVHEIPINCIEVKCLAIGDKLCEFYNLSLPNIKSFKNQDIVNSQLDLNYLVEEEKEFIKARGDDSFIKI